MKTKFFFAKVKSIDEQNRTLDAIASTADLDRDGERLLPSAFAANIESFKSNPVILACHQHRLQSGSSPVIGSADPDSVKLNANDVAFTMRFADTDLGNEYWKLYKDKHMRAFSIGFIPLEWKDERDERDQRQGYIRTYTNIELLEISAVPVPSNRRALARATGYFEDEDTKESVTVALKEQFSILENLKQSIEQQFDDIKAIIIANSGGLADSLLGEQSELPEPGGAEQKMSEHLTKIKNSFGKVD